MTTDLNWSGKPNFDLNWYLNPSTGTHVPKICGVWTTKLWVYYIGNVGNVPCWDYSTSPLDVWQRWYVISFGYRGIYVVVYIYIYIIHRYSMYLWWVVNVRWGRFASLLLLCERNLHCGICSGILNPNRPQHAPTQNYLPLVETQYVWDEVKQCTSSNQRGNNTRIPQTVYDIVWSWNTCI